MMFEIKQLTENEDGSADAYVELDADLMKMVVQEGFTAILLKAIEGYKNEQKLG
jgi:hypothetical protein